MSRAKRKQKGYTDTDRINDPFFRILSAGFPGAVA
jgi:hypothetical protein